MTPAEEKQAERENALAKLNAAWADLALSPAFNTVLVKAQQDFGMFMPSFRDKDGYNPHAAAQRDGQKDVLAYFLRRHARGMEFTEDETLADKPTSAL